MPRVLLADDEETFLKATAELLRARGFECVTAPDGATAAKLLVIEAPFDLLVADIKMPGNADLELVRTLDREAMPPVILMTGYPSLDTAIDAVGLPVVSYLVKPFEFDELMRHVTTAIGRGESRRALEQTRARLDRWREDLDELARTGAKGGLGGDAFVALTLRNVAASLIDLKRMVDGLVRDDAPGDACQILNCPRGLALGEALQEAVSVLEHTKQAFKSKELGDLRRKLELLLRTTVRR